MNAQTKRNLIPYLIVLVTGVIWAATFSLAIIATQSGAHPIGLAFWQALGGALIMFLVCVAKRRWPGRSRTDWLRIIVIAFLGTALPGTLYFYAAIKVPAGILALTIATVPMLTYAAALCFRAESFSIIRLSGVACGILGIVLLSQPEALPDPGLLPWVALALLCALCYTAENIFVDLCVPRQTLLEPVLFGALLIASA